MLPQQQTLPRSEYLADTFIILQTVHVFPLVKVQSRRRTGDGRIDLVCLISICADGRVRSSQVGI